MKKIISFLSPEKIVYLAIILFVFVFVAKTSVIYFPDSKGYLNMVLYRTCAYPMFIELHRLIFGGFFAQAIVGTQCILNIIAPLFVIYCFRKTISLDKWLAIVLYVIMLFPVFMGILTANTILSESLAYPLYMGIIGFLMLGMAHSRTQHFYYAFGLTFLLILVRGQFLFLVPILILAILLTYHKSIFKWKPLLLIAIAVLMFPLSVVTDVIFHKTQHNQAVATPLTGIQLITIPFFVADEGDYAIFKTKEQQDYFRHVYAKLNEKKLLLSQLPSDGKSIDFFFKNYVTICNLTIGENGMEMFPKNLSYDEKMIRNDQMTSAMALPLLKDNFKKWLNIFSGNFMKGFDTSKYFLLYLIMLVVSIIALIRRENLVSKFLILLLLLPIANVALVALVESTVGRYTFYNNWILFAVFLILFQHHFYLRTNE